MRCGAVPFCRSHAWQLRCGVKLQHMGVQHQHNAGSARLGSARLGSARLGSARLGRYDYDYALRRDTLPSRPPRSSRRPPLVAQAGRLLVSTRRFRTASPRAPSLLPSAGRCRPTPSAPTRPAHSIRPRGAAAVRSYHTRGAARSNAAALLVGGGTSAKGTESLQLRRTL
jgi:hypothetical protein